MLRRLLSKSVIWSPEKEKILWDELSRPRANLNAVNWTGLSAQLDVPVPYLIYRAQVKYEQDLKGLQGIRQAPPATSPVDDRPFGSPVQRTRNPLSPTTTTSPLVRRMSSSGAIGSRWSRGSNASTHTIIQPSAPRMARLNPVLTPLRTATGSKPSTPSSGRSTPTSTDSEEEKRDAQKEEADQLAEKLKELQKRMGSGYFGFARPNNNKSPAPSITASQTRSQSQSASQIRSQSASQIRSQPTPQLRSQTARSQTATMSASQMHRSMTTPTGSAMIADSTTSASASMSQRGSIPDIPSPASDSRARLPVRVTRRATSVGTHRSPSAVSEAQERGPIGRTRAHDAGSGQVSSASSFSDISETDMSASALEDALMSNNFKSTVASRMSMFSRAHPSRGTRPGRFV
ncbi:unnamed protein product [Rhizoctonia solani]|uniref:Autophagy-related protein 29 n=1 Tax=Rhizoctonia solani TaxID=456999 RepID=A0A8H3GWM9_9AGAM|nr:unnamed protein product [Rhizoctonia solani]